MKDPEHPLRSRSPVDGYGTMFAAKAGEPMNYCRVSPRIASSNTEPSSTYRLHNKNTGLRKGKEGLKGAVQVITFFSSSRQARRGRAERHGHSSEEGIMNYPVEPAQRLQPMGRDPERKKRKIQTKNIRNLEYSFT